MALKKYSAEYSHSITLNGIEHKFKPWTTKNEKDYLIAVESDAEMTEDKIYDILVKPCLENPDIVLSENEQKLLIIEIRKKSIGHSFPMKFVCNSCQGVNDIDVKLEDIIHYKEANFKDVEVENLKFNFGPVPTEALKQRLSETNTDVEYSFVELLIHIRSITIDDKVEDEFTFNELKEFMESLPTYIFDEVVSEFVEMKSSLEFRKDIECHLCNEVNEVEFDSIPGFLWA